MKTTDSIYGDFALPPFEEDLIAKCLVAYGEWAYAEVLIASTLLQDGDALWDIGAYVGTFALGIAKNRPLSRVLAVDANSEVVQALERNLSNNLDFPFVKLNAGVSLQSGKGVLRHEDESNQGNSIFHLLSDKEAFLGIAVPAVTLKELRLKHGSYDFLKLDIEGMEVDALRGDEGFIKQNKPVIWAECNEDPQSLQLLEVMLSFGYNPVYVAFPAIRTDNFKGNPELFFPMAYEAALVGAVPERLEAFSTAEVTDACIVRPINSKEDLLQALWDTPRWAQEDWVKLSRPELIACIGRLERREQFATFLRSDSTGALSQEEPSQKDSVIFEAKMFWRSVWSEKDNGYTEERASSKLYPVDGQRRVIQLAFPEMIAPVTRLRLDVLDALGVVDVHDMRLLDSSGATIWNWSGEASIIKKNVQTAMLAQPASGVYCTLLSLGLDPQIELNLPDDVYAKIGTGSSLALEITPYPLLDRLPFIFEQLGCRSTAPYNVIEAVSFASSSGLSLVPTHLADGLVAIKDLVQASLAQRDKVIAQQNIQLTRFRDELTRAEAQLDLLKDLMLGGREEDRL